jgi:hypothetical protein
MVEPRGVLHRQNKHRNWNEHTEKSKWYGWQNKTLRAGLCFARSRTGQLGPNLPNKRAVKTLNEVAYVELVIGGGGDCSALIAWWHRGI